MKGEKTYQGDREINQEQYRMTADNSLGGVVGEGERGVGGLQLQLQIANRKDGSLMEEDVEQQVEQQRSEARFMFK
jgi:hypothetical protein